MREADLGGADEALASVLVDRSPNGVLVTDALGRVRMVNPALRQLVPLVPDAIGRHAADVITVDAVVDALAPERVDEVELTLASGALLRGSSTGV